MAIDINRLIKYKEKLERRSNKNKENNTANFFIKNSFL